MAEHRSFVRPDEGWEKPENYLWAQVTDGYCRRDVAGMYTGDGRLKRISCSVCGLGKGYMPSHPCDCDPDAKWEVRVRPLSSMPFEKEGARSPGYSVLPVGGGTLNPVTPHLGPSSDERKLTRAAARADLENEGFVLPAPGPPRLRERVAGDLLKLSLKAS